MKKIVLILAILCVMTSAFCVMQINVIGSFNEPVVDLYDKFSENPSAIIESAKSNFEAGLQFRFVEQGFDLGVESAVSAKNEQYSPVVRVFGGLNVPLFGFINLGNAIGYEINFSEGGYTHNPFYRFSGGIGLGILDMEIYAIMPVTFDNGLTEALNVGNLAHDAKIGVAMGVQF